MEQDKAYSVLEALANGVDPITGECFADDSPYNQPEVIRALFFILRNKPLKKKAKKSLEEKQQENLEKGLPMNYGLPWTQESVDSVIKDFQANIAIDTIAEKMARKPNSIIGLLKKQGVITEEQALAMGLLYRAVHA
ncbi:hypothetical protein C9J01_07640 [Photobacterium rosenbergii]|uniref:Uncharacterized protein n=1 Tax=Photobacterium rosenbergii TaxID=294936 RepID=A0A2T3NGZ6_9GAMM|nr:hypothetical protein [Photobacterium rosenbergii]PSW14307.1 hypothetical protein C9J01_07640 [Photobacterium rosenbergii]